MTTDLNRIYPNVNNPDFDDERDTALTSAGCIPLLWLAAFSDTDLVRQVFIGDGEEVPAYAPIVEREIALSRLTAREGFLNNLFSRSGGLSYHLALFVAHIQSCPGRYITLECEEIECLYSDIRDFQRLFQHALKGLREEDPNVLDSLVELSTILPRRRFITLDDARAGSYAEKDMWNFFRILGESYLRPTGWD